MSRSNARTGNQAYVREMNLAIILQQINDSAPISRAGLAEATGLNKATVSSLVKTLLETGLVREIGLDGEKVGRPAVLLEVNSSAGGIVSGEIGGDFVRVVCTDFAFNIILRYEERIKPDMAAETVLDRLIDLLKQGIDEAKRMYGRLLGVAVGAPGMVDHEDGMILFASSLRWANVPLKHHLEQALGLPVFVDKESNMAALGECIFGVARGSDHVLYLSLGSGVNGSIICEGQIYSGVTGGAGEFGHMLMDVEGEVCNCGNRGCFETRVSQQALFRHLEHAIVGEKHESLLAPLFATPDADLTVSAVLEAAKAGDSVVLEAFNHIGRELGIGIVSLVNIFNPRLVVLGGTLSVASEYLLPAIEREVWRRALPWNAKPASIVPAQYRSDACVIGGAATVYRAILDNPLGLAASSHNDE